MVSTACYKPALLEVVDVTSGEIKLMITSSFCKISGGIYIILKIMIT